MKQSKSSFITRTGLLLALALIFQIGFRAFAQPAVGPLVNLVLLLSAGIVGTASGVLIGCITPLVAFFFGITPLFPLVPFIMLGNTLYVFVFNRVRKILPKEGDIWGMICAAAAKYAFLAISVRYLLTFFVTKVPARIIAAFSLPQLYTALIGGALALVLLRFLPQSVYSSSTLNEKG